MEKAVRFDELTPPNNPVPQTPVFHKSTKEVPCLYKLRRELGTGTYSVVHEVVHTPSNRSFAAKIVSKKLMRGRENLVKNEIEILERVSRGHPNVLTLFDYFETVDSIYLVTELASGGELFERICSRGAYIESECQFLLKQIVAGVAHLHSHGIVHRDLKLENLLFQNLNGAKLLICDFGLSRVIDDGGLRMLTTQVGTLSYMAPEVLKMQGHNQSVDVWALGVIAYVLLCGFTPFDRETEAEERDAICSGNYVFEPEKWWMHITVDAHNFIKSCLQVDPEKRPTADELLKSKFLTRTYRSGGYIQEKVEEDWTGLETMGGGLSAPPERA